VGLLEALVVGFVSAVVSAVLGYVVGQRQAEQQRIIEERARVISDLFKRYVDLDERVYSLVQIYERPEEPVREEKYKLAAESFNELLAYHRRNSIWLTRPTARYVDRYVDRFIERYRESFRPFAKGRGHLDHRRWLEAWQRFKGESPKLRETLEEEFRAALGYRRAKLGAWRRRSDLEPPQRPATERPQSSQSHENSQ
jgi:hypothetical protein